MYIGNSNAPLKIFILCLQTTRVFRYGERFFTEFATSRYTYTLPVSVYSKTGNGSDKTHIVYECLQRFADIRTVKHLATAEVTFLLDD